MAPQPAALGAAHAAGPAALAVCGAVPDALAGVEAVVGPARRRIAEVRAAYTDEQRDLLFDYFARAAPAFREAAEEIRAATHERKGR
ncbi:hypothetical protein [Streptomyces sp. ISL-94]|uniref:hypothetical protein n=1 Tax=Streptomyces sp. ISL-94 TaxID=2819190 RepID=UPI002035E774|nr:hypothetical protein [Streptomyces sp. ISL-94]